MVHLTPLQETELKVQKAVLNELQNTPYVLKGGTALSLTRDLDRFSEDLDFDSSKRLNLETKLKSAFTAVGANDVSINKVHDTNTTQRFKIHYKIDDKSHFLKIETKFKDIHPDSIENINGIQTYKVPNLVDNKLLAAENRTAPRDLYDLSFLIKNHKQAFTAAHLERLEKLVSDDINLNSRFKQPYSEDPLLNNKSYDHIVSDIKNSLGGGRLSMDSKFVSPSNKLSSGSLGGALDNLQGDTVVMNLKPEALNTDDLARHSEKLNPNKDLVIEDAGIGLVLSDGTSILKPVRDATAEKFALNMKYDQSKLNVDSDKELKQALGLSKEIDKIVEKNILNPAASEKDAYKFLADAKTLNVKMNDHFSTFMKETASKEKSSFATNTHGFREDLVERKASKLDRHIESYQYEIVAARKKIDDAELALDIKHGKGLEHTNKPGMPNKVMPFKPPNL